MTDVWHALSVKQPWAALLVSGRKTIEIRTWNVSRRERILIHAAKIPDLRPEGWAALDTPELRALAQFQGGILGVAELIDCIRYDTSAAFATDAPRHCNAPEWFRPPRLFGFVFEDAQLVPFAPWTGNTFFFAVKGYTLPEVVIAETPLPAVVWIDPPEGPRKGFPAP